MTAMLALALALLGTAVTPARAADSGSEPRVTIAMVPAGTGVERLSTALPGASIGVLSPGLGEVPAGQTYLDVTQGSRLAQSLYPDDLSPLYVTGEEVPARLWRQVRERAEDAPAEIEPGLLAERLGAAGVPIASEDATGSAALIAVGPDGRVERADCEPGECPGVTVAAVEPRDLEAIAGRLDPGRGDLLIALERPPAERKLLATAIAGAGFEGGELTSATTRMAGYVAATDLLPTILGRFGIAVPDEDVTGREIEATGDEVDAAALADREERLTEIRDRRWGVIAVNLLIWTALAALACAIGRRRGARIALPMLATTMAVVPALLLLTAGIAPSEAAERAIVGAGAPLLAAVALAVSARAGRGPYGAFAAAAALSVGATAVDVILGSPLTALSLLGSNPALGVRFFGIGNELEATIGVLLPLGTGAAVAAARPADAGRAMAIAIVAVTALAVLVFAPGRLGADVGAAITFPAGAAVAVVVALRLSVRGALLVLAAPIVAVAALLVIDLVSGGDAHLSRSVLGAGGLDDLGDVLDRRVTQSARSFPRYLDSPFFAATVLAIALGLAYRRRIAGWLDSTAARAGVAGAIAATVVGTLANDSGALLLMVGTGYVVAFCGLAWADGGGGETLAEGRGPR